MSESEIVPKCSAIPDRKDCVFTECYCEENVWLLLDRVRKDSPDHLSKCYAVFISNQYKSVPVWYQKASNCLENPMVWDYHVIMVMCLSPINVVYDLQSILEFPCPFAKYSELALKDDEMLLDNFYRNFRVIPGKEFLETFASDRSHMIQDGSWLSPPPSYEAIKTKDSLHNIDEFISMDPSKGWGQICTLKEFNQMFSPAS